MNNTLYIYIYQENVCNDWHIIKRFTDMNYNITMYVVNLKMQKSLCTSSCQIHSRLLADPCIGPRDNHRLPVQASCTVAPTSPHPSPENNDSYPCNSMQNTNSIHYDICIWHVVVNAVLWQCKVWKLKNQWKYRWINYLHRRFRLNH